MDKKLPIPQTGTELANEPTTDISELDQVKINTYVAAGLPGLYELKDESVTRMMDLYLAGKPYSQISRILKVDTALVMFMSQKFNWFIARREYLFELEATIRNRLLESKVISQDFLLQLTHLYQKKIGKKVSSYLSTDDESHANAIDGKDVDKVLKIMDMLHKISSEAAVGKPTAPAVGLNLGEGVTVTKNEDGSVEITPKQKTVSEMLKQFADARREAEKKKD